MATATTEHAGTNPTISPYHNGLTGVNQPVNMLFKDMLWWTLGILALFMLTVRLLEIAWTKLRQVSAMSSPAEKQGYWKFSQWSWMPSLKNHLIYAPLWNKRHNREIRLSSAISIGTLPSRLHFILLGLYFVSNFVYMFVLDWKVENKYAFCAELRGRSGTLAAVNMVPLIIMAGRNNPLIGMLRVSFDTYNLLHRWMGRFVVLESVIHTIAWAIVQVADGGWDSVGFKIVHDSFIASGACGTVALVILVVLSLSPIRHAFYETFLNVHIILAIIVFVCTWAHCATAEIPGGLPQLPWMVAILLLWFADRFARMLRLVYYNWSKNGFTEAKISALPCEATRVELFLPRHAEIRPGTHAYLRFRDVKPWESHPFSVAYVSHHPRVNGSRMELEKVAVTRDDIERGTTSVSFIIGAHTGFTRALYDKASQSEGQSIIMKAAMEGPYAGHHQLDSYGHAVLFCGSTGITHQLSYIKPIIEGYNDGTIATRRVTLVWVIREFEALEWIRPWMNEILRMDNRRDILNMQVFVTRPKNPNQIQSPSSTVKVFSGRPNIMTILKKEVEQQVGAMAVTVCGPGALADDVREAVRDVQNTRSVVDFVEESFTW
ncbi:Ferric/cupric reductase transmembrane component 7 [Apiospora kogelbergensis]|uniref:Ferric/cupric reductase transmembrane component 7 n=1 Tax=Apiospora kogelbergensis TaxID=1337665 RepID=UPI00312D3A84